MTLLSQPVSFESMLINIEGAPKLKSQSSYSVLSEKENEKHAPYSTIKKNKSHKLKEDGNLDVYKSIITINYEEEFLNAITMLAPVLVSINFLPQINDRYGMAIALHTFIHTPFSMAHHFNLALKDPYCGQVGYGLIFRRLDYTFIHVSCIMLTYGLSRSEVFGVIGAILNTYAIFKVWTNPKRPQRPSHSLQGLCVLLYSSMMLLHGNYLEFLLCLFTFYLCFVVYRLGKKMEMEGGCGMYFHPMMHVMLALPQFFMHITHPEVNRAFLLSW